MGAKRPVDKFFPQKFVLGVFHHLFLRVSVYILVIKLFEEGTGYTVLSFFLHVEKNTLLQSC